MFSDTTINIRDGHGNVEVLIYMGLCSLSLDSRVSQRVGNLWDEVRGSLSDVAVSTYYILVGNGGPWRMCSSSVEYCN